MNILDTLLNFYSPPIIIYYIYYYNKYYTLILFANFTKNCKYYSKYLAMSWA